MMLLRKASCEELEIQKILLFSTFLCLQTEMKLTLTGSVCVTWIDHLFDLFYV